MVNRIDIAKIGVGSSESISFFWKQQTYKLLVHIDFRALFKDVKNVEAFEIEVRSDGSLWLILVPELLQDKCKSGPYLRSLRDLIETFFVVERENLFDTDDDDSHPTNDDTMEHNDRNEQVAAEASTNSIELAANDFDDDHLPTTFFDELYQKLRDAHEQNGYVGHSYTDEYVQHADMRPTLTPYQKQGIKWMLNRENGQRFYPTEFKAITLRWLHSDKHTFYYNSRSIQIKIDQNDDVRIPSGGILADAMGLGKTVEMLTLILLNRRTVASQPILTAAYDNCPAISENEAIEVVVRCLCPAKTNKSIVRCNECQLYQHRECVAQSDTNATPDRLYYCPYCWKHREPLRVKTTFIVSPSSIKMQWYDEIVKHIATTDFRVLVYNGMKNSKTKWTNPYELGSYDIVLTDYNTLQTEFYYSDPNPSDRKLRHPPRFITARSPLLSVHWWRICLDEAQMASSVISSPAKMVAKLGAQHRWAVTGTPIQKSMDDLYGLVAFLSCSPYNERNKWLDVLNEFHCRINLRPIIAVLEPIMWRTCKSKAIMSQINIPEQSELVHFIKLSDIEYFHYNAEHAKCWDAFYNNACKYDTTSRLAGFNPHVFKIILEPLRKLRQDCSVPRAAELSGKRIMQQDELLKHLLKNSENDAKSQLRSVTSSLNGMAALHIIKDNAAEAAKLYRCVLQWANEYNDRIAVDSLLQIHSIHNLLAIDEMMLADERQQLSATMNRLESKFLLKSINLVNSHQLALDKWQAKAAEINEEFRVNAYQWWIDVMYEEIENPTTLQKKIDIDIPSSYGRDKWNKIRETYASLRSISVVLTTWLDDVLAKRDELMDTFVKLRSYSEHFKPLAEVDEKIRDRLTALLDHAYSCHLFAIRANGQMPNVIKRAKMSLCLLCETKRKLDVYEAIIFNKDVVDNVDTVYGGVSKGSWKAPHQETTLQIIASHMRLKGKRDEDAKHTMKYLDTLKNEFKEYSQLWVETNHTVSAYDEIKMCKSRTEAVNRQVDGAEEHLSNLVIHLHEVDHNMAQLQQQKNQAELNFIRTLGQLKYLAHLEKNKDVEECPVCKTLPEHKYAVLECGHHMCMTCYAMWSARKSTFNCVVCRYEQYKSKMYFVSISDYKQLTDSSSKIEQITRHVLTLMKEDPAVKIVIFSQWSVILANLEKAFAMNKISYRNNLHRFHESVREFKDEFLGVTCLLLPIAYGSKGLNLTEATHVFFAEPILSPGDELQAIGRIHRIGQTKNTYVHRFIVKNTIEESIHKAIANDSTGLWASQKFTIESLMELFTSTDIFAEAGQ